MNTRPSPADATSAFNGTWEQSGRSPNTAALLGLIGIGALYFNIQSVLAFLTVFLLELTIGSPEQSGDFLDRMLAIVKFYADPLRAMVLVTQYVFMLLPALYLVKRWHTSDVRSYIRLKTSSPVEILLAVLTTLAVIPASNFVSELLMRQIRIPDKLMEIGAELFTARSPAEFIWLVAVVCLTPAFCEEVFFRGFVQRTFERTMGWKSILLTGIFFGLFHFQPLGLLTLSILGILFGYFFYRSESLLPPMAAHFTNNFVAIFFLYQTPEMQEAGVSAAAVQMPLWLVGATLPLAIALLFVYHKATQTRKNKDIS